MTQTTTYQIQQSPARRKAVRGMMSWYRDEESLRVVIPQRNYIDVNHAAGDPDFGDASPCSRVRLLV